MQIFIFVLNFVNKKNYGYRSSAVDGGAVAGDAVCNRPATARRLRARRGMCTRSALNRPATARRLRARSGMRALSAQPSRNCPMYNRHANRSRA